jgi:phosphoesterase RecJ-like protein
MLVGVEISVLLWEMGGGERRETKISLRASGAADVSKIAMALGGGGHRAAAGANIPDDLDATEAMVLALAHDVLTESGR